MAGFFRQYTKKLYLKGKALRQMIDYQIYKKLIMEQLIHSANQEVFYTGLCIMKNLMRKHA